MGKHPAIGRCIYCGASPTPLDTLQDEHIIPFGLGGTHLLRKASCGNCADKTSAIEMRVLRGELGGLRTAVGFPSRRKRGRPITLPMDIKSGGTWKVVDVPLSDYTPVIVLPDFGPPARLDSGRDYIGGIELIGYASNVAKRDYARIADKYNAEVLAVRSLYDPVAWAQMLAKIAYAYAVHQFGLNGLEKIYVLDAIMGKANDVGMWVGNDGKKLIRRNKDGGHAIAHQIVGNDLYVRIKPFDWIDAIEYVVVVGRLIRGSGRSPENGDEQLVPTLSIRYRPRRKLFAALKVLAIVVPSLFAVTMLVSTSLRCRRSR